MTERKRYWLINYDDTPISPERPLSAEAAAEAFLREVLLSEEEEDEGSALIEIRQCTREDLDWAGVEDGIGSDELDKEIAE